MMSSLITGKLYGLPQQRMGKGDGRFSLVKVRALADKLVNRGSVNKLVNSTSAGALAPGQRCGTTIHQRRKW